MKQSDKDLLLKDLLARLPYNVMCRVKFCYKYSDGTMRKGYKDEMLNIEILDDFLNGSDAVEKIQLYLRPMSSMTKEERKELYGLLLDIERLSFADILERGKDTISPAYDWLNAHHFDYRGLMTKGLAIEVTEKNNPYKE